MVLARQGLNNEVPKYVVYHYFGHIYAELESTISRLAASMSRQLSAYLMRTTFIDSFISPL